eukprot:364870-Chlamydomonas_euryale.AAC.19
MCELAVTQVRRGGRTHGRRAGRAGARPHGRRMARGAGGAAGVGVGATDATDATDATNATKAFGVRRLCLGCMRQQARPCPPPCASSHTLSHTPPAHRSGLHAQGHRQSINCVSFSCDSKQLATVSDDLTVRVWDLASGNCTEVLTGHDQPVTSVMFSPRCGHARPHPC